MALRRQVAVVAALALSLSLPIAAEGSTLRPGFRETIKWTGLANPTTVRFAPFPDTRVFVAEKGGRVRVYDNLSDTTPTTVADLRSRVHDFWDRGMLGLAVDPQFPARPYIYVLYPHDPTGRWGDDCPTPPGPTADGCVIEGRLSKLTIDPTTNTLAAPEQVLLGGWCQQYPSHSTGSLAFGPDGALYATAGDGASYTFIDYGQKGSPRNPCGDPPAGVGGTMTPPTAEGGALRSQDLRTSGDPAALNGAVLRLDPDTGAGLPDNPGAASSDPNVRRIVAHGLRNPFRMTIRPGTDEVWMGDVGMDSWEEVNRVPDPTGDVLNFGWPCYEGSARQGSYDNAGLDICEDLYSAEQEAPGTVTPPYFSYSHWDKPVPGEACPTGTSSPAGVAFYTGGHFPDAYDGALFFADYSRRCIWAMLPGPDGLPSPTNVQTFASGAAGPVDLQIGPDGALYYVDLVGDSVRRITYESGNRSPTADARATPSSGPAPLAVSFDARGSTDPDTGDTLSYAWDLDGDGAYDDSTSATPSRTYTSPGNVLVGLRVSDREGATDTDTVLISPANSPPQATISGPTTATRWAVGDRVDFGASATDSQDASLPETAFRWELLMNHCPDGCHTHEITTYEGRSGSFVAPDHEYPSRIELRLTVTDSGGLTDTESIEIEPRTVRMTMASSPPGAQLSLGPESTVAPFTRTVIVGSRNSVAAPGTQTIGGLAHHFVSWSDGGAQSHDFIAPATDATLTATYATPPVVTTRPVVSGTARDGDVLTASTGAWAGTAPIGYERQWRRCDTDGESCADIAGAVGESYALTAADVGKTIVVEVTADNAAPGEATAVSDPSDVVAFAPPVNTVRPAVSGLARDGETLTSTTGTWTGTPEISYVRQWQRCDSAGEGCANVSGANGATYALTAADLGKRLRVVVTADNGAAGTVSATSDAGAPVQAVAPANTALPAISGTMQDGQTLVATTGSWTGTPEISYGYQWRRCDSSGAGCSNIPGATGASYPLAAADVGKTLRVVVTADNAAPGTVAATSVQTSAIAALPPHNDVPPAVTGTARDGETLGSALGSWSGTAPIALGRRWLRCDGAGVGCAVVSGATAATYELGPADVGRTLRLEVTADNAALGETVATSAPTAVVEPRGPASTAAPVISGTARDGQSLSASNGTWTGTPPLSFARRWRRCDAGGASCSDIPGATGSSLMLGPDDVGRTLRVVVTATNAAPGSASATSAPSAVVAPAPPESTSAPVVSGLARDGETLASTTGTWSGTEPISHAREWLRCDSAGESCAPIAGATAATYELTSADVGGTLRVRVTADNAGPGTQTATSEQTAVVEPVPPANEEPPAVIGTARDGESLSSTPGSWSGTRPMSYERQWLRCDGSGEACAGIAGATGESYILAPADVGRTIRLHVTAGNAASGAGTALSEPTPVVAANPPLNVSRPSISGTPRAGETLVASLGAWSGTPAIDLLGRWLRCGSDGAGCSAIDGATGESYLLATGDVGSRIRVSVTADNAAPGSAEELSEPTAMVEEAADLQPVDTPSGGQPPQNPPPGASPPAQNLFPPPAGGGQQVGGRVADGASPRPIVKAGRIHFRIRRRRPELWLNVRCRTARCNVWATAKITFPGARRAVVRSLAPARRGMRIGQKARLRLKLPRAVRRRLLSRAARRRRPRASVRVYVAHEPKPLLVARKRVRLRMREPRRSG